MELNMKDPVNLNLKNYGQDVLLDVSYGDYCALFYEKIISLIRFHKRASDPDEYNDKYSKKCTREEAGTNLCNDVASAYNTMRIVLPVHLRKTLDADFEEFMKLITDDNNPVKKYIVDPNKQTDEERATIARTPFRVYFVTDDFIVDKLMLLPLQTGAQHDIIVQNKFICRLTIKPENVVV